MTGVYTIDLAGFHGPLDLLLYLVKKNELDLLDIPIADIAAQFSAFLDDITLIDIEWAGEFLLTSASLLELKSQLLLPRPTHTSGGREQMDPRQELVKQLLDYRATKEATTRLQDLNDQRIFHQARVQPPENEGVTSRKVKPVEIWDLVSTFARLMRDVRAAESLNVSQDDTPQAVYMEELRQRVRAAGQMPFRDIFLPPFTRFRLLGYFLALLELLKQHELLTHQDQPDSPITVLWNEEPPPTVPMVPN
ncbi:MAG: ScpA family protein [Zavarzinella sp.]